jgi:cardiolipin synthase
VAEFQRLFLQLWTAEAAQQVWEENNFPPLHNVGHTLVRVVASTGGGQDYTIYKAYLAALELAQQRIWVTQAYFTPTDAFLEALQAAARRGVDVRILLPGVSDQPVVRYAAHARYTALLKAGVQLYERDDRILHAKTAVIDGIWSTVGSSNWDYLSFVHNDEANAVLLGRECGQQMEALFQQDLRQARSITLQQWQTRPLRERVMETLSLLFQYWF